MNTGQIGVTKKILCHRYDIIMYVGRRNSSYLSMSNAMYISYMCLLRAKLSSPKSKQDEDIIAGFSIYQLTYWCTSFQCCALNIL